MKFTWSAHFGIGLQLLALGNAGLVLLDGILCITGPPQLRLVLRSAEVVAVQHQRECHLRVDMLGTLKSRYIIIILIIIRLYHSLFDASTVL